MRRQLTSDALDLVFRGARSHNGWIDKPVEEILLRQVYDIAKWGPTSANCSPARFVFLVSAESKHRLAAHVSSGNLKKTLTAPVCVIMAYDRSFADFLPSLFPHRPEARTWFSDPASASTTALRNASLQSAYFMIAARSLGLDCGPMSGFDAAGVDREFFGGTTWSSNFLCALGQGDPAALFPRLPRLPFDDACQVL